jgi:phosphoribosyl-AMP cyclohydrolase
MMSAKQEQVQNWMDEIAWSPDGLVVVVVQDAPTGAVLMSAWMNREALALTVERGEAHYWSRSRQRLWRKGEESGHLQKVKELRLDCDGDAILLRVEQQGGIACHTGRARCFFRRYQEGGWVVTDPVLKDPDEIYGGPGGAPTERLR